MSLQEVAIIGLLFFSIVFSKFFKAIPRDLIFTVGSLLTSFLGIVSSKQIFAALVSQPILAVLGLWILAKAMQSQGVFESAIKWFVPCKKEKHARCFFFYVQTVICGAFFYSRYFLLTTVRPLLRRGAEEKWDLESLGYPFHYLIALGGLATALSTSVNVLLLDLYSVSVGNVLSSVFLFFPFAILPIISALLFFLLFHKVFRKPFPIVFEESRSAVVLPDSLLIGRKAHQSIFRNGKHISSATPLESGDFLILEKNVKASLFTLLDSSHGHHVLWKQITVFVIFIAAIVVTILGVPIGTTFLCAGAFILIFGFIPIKKTFREEFPLPVLLEIFSAHLFFYAMLSSHLNGTFAGLFFCKCPYFCLPIFFVLAHVAAHFMPRPIAFATLFSVALALFAGFPIKILFTGIVVAFASTIPLFGKPTIGTLAIAKATSPKPSLIVSLLLSLLLFVTTLIPACLFWPK